MPRTRPEVTTMGQALDAGFLDRMNWVNSQFSTQAEKVDYLRSVYPNVSSATMRAMIDQARNQDVITGDYNDFGNIPANRDIPILGSLPYGTRTYRLWFRVTITFSGAAGGDYPTGTRTTVYAVDQVGTLDPAGASFDITDPAISRIMGEATVPAGSHGDVFSDVQVELVAVGRSNFGR